MPSVRHDSCALFSDQTNKACSSYLPKALQFYSNSGACLPAAVLFCCQHGFVVRCYVSVTTLSVLRLRFAGLSQDKVFCKNHRFLSRGRWNTLKASRILLHQLIDAFCKQASSLVFAIDETIERRRGKASAGKGSYGDPVCSSVPQFV